ncbi:MAG: heme exporter protein CcmB, partial [Pseudomonadota bacterium]
AMVIAAPFAAPVLVFGVSAAKSYLAGAGLLSPETLILGALSLFMAATTPGFAIAALKISLE